MQQGLQSPTRDPQPTLAECEVKGTCFKTSKICRVLPLSLQSSEAMQELFCQNKSKSRKNDPADTAGGKPRRKRRALLHAAYRREAPASRQWLPRSPKETDTTAGPACVHAEQVQSTGGSLRTVTHPPTTGYILRMCC